MFFDEVYRNTVRKLSFTATKDQSDGEWFIHQSYSTLTFDVVICNDTVDTVSFCVLERDTLPVVRVEPATTGSLVEHSTSQP